ncbi:hypothetical protein AVEN_127872-1 [Araneus ventricosus]|uniref:Uncharacterized protein n=1 Tax=Araneus ventricosus TaxID=182803 RepID=A0A4Y1ZYX9_ARAVE|nr:hypothetical protein AVEN_127872-1 [Araneus ventricosus]
MGFYRMRTSMEMVENEDKVKRYLSWTFESSIRKMRTNHLQSPPRKRASMSVHSQNSILRWSDRPLSDLQHLHLVWVILVCLQNAHGTALTDSHLRRQTSGPFPMSSTRLDVSSSVAVFGLPDMLASATEPALLNLMTSFATVSCVICLLCVALKVCAT